MLLNGVEMLCADVVKWIGNWIEVEAHTGRNRHDMKPYLYFLCILFRRACKKVFRKLMLKA